MSFILDALKKSESDRQRQNAPDISDVPLAAAKSTAPRWLLLLVALLAVNLLVLVVVLFKPSAVGTQSPVQSAVTIPEVVSKPAAQSPQMAAELKPASRSEAPGPAIPDDRPVNRQPEPVGVDSIPTVQRVAPAVTETRLTFNDLRLAGDLNLPDLNIDIHVYSEAPPDRFVFINMNQYRENATLTEGPLVREITTEGVVLEYGGATFLLPKN
jgi:general secretion pathway protein B